MSSSLAISGLASGVDWQSIVTQLANAERAPETQWKINQSTINQKNNAFGTIKSYLNNLQADITKLKDPTFFSSRTASSSDSAMATATADSGATTGTFTFNISQLATASQITGASNISEKLVPTGNPADVTVGTAGFSTTVNGGTFTINGAQVTISQSDSLQTVFDNIASATGNAVTASYDSASDTISLNSASAITLGSAADTSNFLQVAQLYSDGSGSITSTSALGRAKLTASLGNAGLATTISDGGSGSGEFTVNGVSINFNASTDSLQDVLNRINSSNAGVNASYDSLNNRFVLTNKITGNLGVSVQDVTGNFLAATGLSSGTVTNGKNLTYTVNNSSQELQSQSNVITGDSSTITGLSVTALQTGSVTVTVGSDTNTIQSAIQSFADDYNKVQEYIASQSASSTDSAGKVTAGLLTGDIDAGNIASSLRSNAFSPISVSGLSATFSQLANLGINSSGYSNSVTVDATTLSDALTNNLSQVATFFSDSTSGWAVNFNKYLDSTIGDSGSLVAHQDALTKQSQSIDTQIANLEKQVTADSDKWTVEFQNMETAQSKVNNELSYLTQSINSGSL